MTAQSALTDSLNRQFFVEFPLDAAKSLEGLAPEAAASAMERLPATALLPVWERLLPETAAAILRELPGRKSNGILAALPPARAARILGHLNEDEREQRCSTLEPGIRADLEMLLSYEPNTAGSLMDVAVPVYRLDTTVRDALRQLRKTKMKTARSLFLVDAEQRLVGKVGIQQLVIAPQSSTLDALKEPVTVVVRPVDSLQQVTDAFEQHRVLDLPVVDVNGVFVGAVTHDSLARTVHAEAVTDIQSMVGAGRDERALSSPLFTVRKRMPWLQINLLTAFLAAAVVGLFEQTIAQVTALAVLLPVVAGQSGNAGAQALAVTMRGLALREITVRQWFRVMRKEVIAGLLNGLAIAVSCGIGVYVWSQSPGLVAVIASSMVLAMVAAGFAGAIIPIILTRLGQDPATSSSIVLTTVTDVAGFFSFLGIATLFMGFLQ